MYFSAELKLFFFSDPKRTAVKNKVNKGATHLDWTGFLTSYMIRKVQVKEYGVREGRKSCSQLCSHVRCALDYCIVSH